MRNGERGASILLSLGTEGRMGKDTDTIKSPLWGNGMDEFWRGGREGKKGGKDGGLVGPPPDRLDY